MDLKRSNGWFYAGLALVSVIWGANFGVSRWTLDVFPPAVFVFLRFGLAIPVLFAMLRLSEGSVRVEGRDLIRMAVMGFFGCTVLELTVMYSIKYTTLANSSLLNVAPWPIFAALFAPLFTKEKLTLRLVTGGIIALVGVALIILGGGQGFSLSSKYMLGNGMALGVSLIGALYNLATMPLMAKYSPLKVSTWLITFGVLFLFPITWKDWSHVHWHSLTAGAWIAVAYNVLFCTVAAFVIWNLCMNKVGATKSNFYRYLVPAAAATAGILFFREPVWPIQIAGGIVMATGLLWISMERPDAAGKPLAGTGD